MWYMSKFILFLWFIIDIQIHFNRVILSIHPPTNWYNIMILKVEHLYILDKNNVDMLLFRNRFDGFQKFNFIKHPEQWKKQKVAIPGNFVEDLFSLCFVVKVDIYSTFRISYGFCLSEYVLIISCYEDHSKRKIQIGQEGVWVFDIE